MDTVHALYKWTHLFCMNEYAFVFFYFDNPDFPSSKQCCHLRVLNFLHRKTKSLVEQNLFGLCSKIETIDRNLSKFCLKRLSHLSQPINNIFNATDQIACDKRFFAVNGKSQSRHRTKFDSKLSSVRNFSFVVSKCTKYIGKVKSFAFRFEYIVCKPLANSKYWRNNPVELGPQLHSALHKFLEYKVGLL
jgi:hypothetical protein